MDPTPPTPEPTPAAASGAADAPPDAEKAREREQYASFEGFLRAALRDEYRLGWKDHRGRFVSLMIASGQIANMAAEKLETGTTAKKIFTVAGALLLLRLGLKFLGRGPLGAVIVGSATAAAVAYVALNYQSLAPKIQRYKDLIASIRPRYGEIQTGLRDGRFSPPERDLMVDGLLHQFLEQIRAEA